jgi:hypothetical protein
VTIETSIYLSDNSTQISTSVSFSSDLLISCQEKVKQLTETYVKAVEEVLSKVSSGSTQRNVFLKSGLRSDTDE